METEKAVAIATACSPVTSARSEHSGSESPRPEPPRLRRVAAETGSGCSATSGPATQVWPRPGPTDLTFHEGSYVVAGYSPRPGGGEELFLVSVDAPSTLPRTLRAVPLSNPISPNERLGAPTVLSLGPDGLLIAVVDAAGRLLASEVGTEARWAPVLLAESVDTRFAPAMTNDGEHRLVAWVKRGTPMRVEVAVLDRGPKVVGRHRVTPPSMGGTAPTFLRGRAGSTLVFMDARAGVSNLLAVRFDRGEPSSPVVLRPVGSAAPFPDLAAVSHQTDAVAVAYTALGGAATTAIGFVRSGSDERAVPMVAGTGYGLLTVDAERNAFVAGVPRDEPPDAPREIHVRFLDEEGELDQPIVLRGSGPTARRPSIAGGEPGEYAVAYETGRSVELVHLRCAHRDG